MSGGVDSSLAAALLVRRGWDVVGLTMQIWQESQTDARHAGCCSLGAVEDARRVARALGIPHYVVNLKEAFKRTVIDDFVASYARGETPNPCVQCNRHIKFDLLHRKMRELGCERLATGHYARVRAGADGARRLLVARAAEKDQSYVLYMLGQAQLADVAFPLGELAGKSEARALARELGLCVADKPESQDICFVGEAGGYKEFLKSARPGAFVPGELVSPDGRSLGRHDGVAGFTVGQRRGLGLAAGSPRYVVELRPERREVVVGEARDLLTREVDLKGLHWPSGVESPRMRVRAKVRYNMEARPATLIGGPEPRLLFDAPVRAAAPGQIAVAYRGKTLVAGGTIARR